MDFKEFLENVVGSGSFTQDEDGIVNVTPYELVVISETSDFKSGYISFKGTRFQEFNCDESDFRFVRGFADSLNHGYTQALKDVIFNGNISNTIKPFKFV